MASWRNELENKVIFEGEKGQNITIEYQDSGINWPQGRSQGEGEIPPPPKPKKL